ncbi:RNA-guided endonuclease InsQ/TnpB family protein [Aneurinibacillus tyrosinisolvens]|uniref:RNA-guided endonuclease InsQ/TnpB family protein n=1 Tax=Aneurinibacillus tyrosinisolvens TaxID=1443435 RepID=UPI00063F8FA4|nr:RNA-guided endonuclease TnpB family protein [Aneurinibacillus tyrosinisolvens]
MPTLSIKLPLFEPTKTKEEMYETMRSRFSLACNKVLELKKDNPKLKKSEIDRLLSEIELPSTLHQEARKLALSRYQDWKKNKKTKGFPSFKEKISILFNNQNWQLRFDNGYLKVGIPTVEEGNLTMDKYVPVKVNAYSLFWVNYYLTGEMDKESKYFQSAFEEISKAKKGSAQLYYKKEHWYFSFSLSFELKEKNKAEKSIGVDRGLRLVAVAGNPETGKYITFNGKQMGHIRRKFSRLRHKLQKAKNTKALKQLEDKEQRINKYWNHVISKRMVEFALECGASMIKIEDLSGIRSMKKFWKRSDRNVNSWAFYDLESKLTYKAMLAELSVQKVNPYKTSQECSKCHTIKKSNRRKDVYKCSSCGHKENADINASFNIASRPSIVNEDNPAA